MPKIYFLAGPPDDEIFVKEIAQLTESTFVPLTDPVDAADSLQESGSVVFVSDQLDDARVHVFDRAVRAKYCDPYDLNRIHYIVDPKRLDAKDPVYHIPSGGSYVIRRYHEGPVAAAAIYARIVKTTLRDRAFGLHNLLADGTPIVKFTLEKTADRDTVVQSAQKFFNDSGIESRIALLATNAVDELLMNAIFDAPAIGNQRPLHTLMPRTYEFPFDGKHRVQLFLGIDGDHIAISVVDQFGSLDRNSILSHMTRNMTANPFSPNAEGVQSNGLGLVLLFKSGASFLVSSEKNQKTEVSILLRRSTSYRNFRNQLQFISTQIYVDEGEVMQ